MRLLQDPVVKRPGDQMMEFLGTSAGRQSNISFKFNSQTH